MAPSPSSSGATTSVQVALRIRPPTNQDSTSIPARFQRTVINAISPTSVAVDAFSSNPSSVGSSTSAAASTSSATSGKKQIFTFDQVHSPSANQHAIFTTTALPLLSRFIEGFNCTILAYGQTSSGKTFTMTGIDLDADPTDPSNGMGIIPRAVASIFARCRELKEERGNTWNFNIKGSFIEIYNEDLIDLLGMDDAPGKTMIQIREDKQGHILWEGLREVNVRNANEVMNLIRQGTSIRRTNETDMNAQSSRSHAIFSLTLTQRKYVGSGPAPRSSSPLPPSGRSPSRLARPSSTIHGSTRVSSPTFGRPSTPSFASAIGRGGRPASSLGLLTADGGRRQSLAPGNTQTNGDSDSGEWVTVVSKFHFVDLAGSERLKRTAAAGERVKEGISINSGLLALGNVISALGDPSRVKSNTASYVPYRDSKLTRLLQDSLGGNAHTLMIACVSPAEWNANETVNTLKYANRARNIKNRVVMNEKEEGWDDVEWLQAMVTRLRKDLKALKEGGAATLSANGESREVQEGATKKVFDQMAELRSNYEEIRAKYVERTEELTRLRRELAEKQRANGGAVGGTAKYEEIVGPVIEEYEKTISAIEAELSLNRAALRHTNDLVDEKEAELAQLTDRHAITEMYVEDLKARVVKLTEREASTEAYIRDLEDKIKFFDESSVSSSGSISDLKRELAKIKDKEYNSAEYILDLETRLTKSDASVLELRQQVQDMESECQKRRDEVTALQSRLEHLQKDAQGWRADLEEREDRISHLETKLKEREAALKEAGQTRQRLSALVQDVTAARQDVEVASIHSGVSSVQGQESPTETQLIELQKTHAAILHDYNEVSRKYKDAIREIADLHVQLEEAKVNASIPSSRLSESPERPTEVSSPRRRMPRGLSKDLDVQTNGTGRRLFYRHAVSTESLHSRSVSQSLSLSQELSSARSRKASISSHGTSSSLSMSPQSRPTLSLNVNPNERSVQSLEAEIKRLQEIVVERENEITMLEQSLKEKESKSAPLTETPPTTSPGTPVNGDAAPNPLASLSPKTMNQFQELRLSLNQMEDGATADDEGSLDRLNELMRSMAQKESSHREIVDRLNAELNQVKRQHDELKVLSSNQALNMSNEMQGLRNQHEDSLRRFEQVQRREEDLTDALRKAEAQHSSEIATLKAEHEDAMKVKEAEVDALLARVQTEHEAALVSLRDELASASAALEKARNDHEEVFGKLQAEHEEELSRRSREVDETLERFREEHEVKLAVAVETAHQAHQEVTAELQADHDAELKRCDEEHTAALELARLDHERALAKAQEDYQATSKLKEEEAMGTLQRTEEEYYNALTKLRADHAQALEKQATDAATVLERLKDEHTRALRMAEIAREGSLSESQSARDLVIKELQDAHAAAIAHKEALFATDLQKLKDDHTATLAAKEEQHRTSVQRLKADHAASLHSKEVAHNDIIDKLSVEHSRLLAVKDAEHQATLEKLALEHSAQLKSLKEEAEAEIVRLTAELEKGHSETVSSTTAVRKEMEDALQQVKEQQAAILQEVARGHEDEVSKLLSAHRQALAEAENRSKEEAQKLYALEIAQLQTDHQAATVALQSDLASAQEQHVKEMQDARAETEKILQEERTRLTSSLSDLEAKQADEVAILREDNSTLSADKAALASKLGELEASRASEVAALQKERENLIAEKTRLDTDLESHHAAEKAMLQQEHFEEVQFYKEELQSYKAASQKSAAALEEAQQKYEAATQQKDQTITTLGEKLSTANEDRDLLREELNKLRAELDDARGKTAQLLQETSKHQSLVEELNKHRSTVAEMQETLQKTKDDMDALQAEKSRQDAVLRDLQAQLTRSPSPKSSRPNGIPAAKAPPVAPLPSVPVQPSFKSLHDSQPSTASSITVSAMSSRSMDSFEAPSTPATSVAHSSQVLMSPSASQAPDPKLFSQVQEQAKQIEEQEAMIKTLNKQLSHCEHDLQAHIDMVTTLENSLAESEKNLRKARMQATEIARERDNLNTQVTALRNELHDAKNEVVNVRRSIVEEKQSLEHRLDEERRAKERARAQLDSRMEELQKRKSKFACL